MSAKMMLAILCSSCLSCFMPKQPKTPTHQAPQPPSTQELNPKIGTGTPATNTGTKAVLIGVM